MDDFLEQRKNRIYELRDSIEEQHDLVTALYNPRGKIETADLMGVFGLHVTLYRIIWLVEDFERDFPDEYLDRVDKGLLNNMRDATNEGFNALFKALGALDDPNHRRLKTNLLGDLNAFYL